MKRLAHPLAAAVATFWFAALVAGPAAARAADGDQPPWPAEVKNFKPVQPGEHPRLLFRKSDLPRIRRRAATPEGKRIVQRLRKLLDGKNGETMTDVFSPAKEPYPLGRYRNLVVDKPACYTFSHAAGYGMLYQVTGEKKYAELGRKCFEKAFAGVRDRDSRYSFKAPGGALRAGPSLGWYAVGYDLCCDGWDEAFRRKVAEAIENYDEGKHKSLPELVRGARHMPASNHWGMQVGGGALALLAIMKDPGIDQKRIDDLLAQSEKAMIRNVTEGFGDHGWFAEGDGTGVMASHIVYLPAIQAWRVAGGKDFATPRPNVRWTVLKFVMQTIPRNNKPDFPKRGAYPHNLWSREGISGPGTFCEGFGAVTEKEKPALLWLYNRASRKLDEDADGPFETASAYPHRPILSLVNWPFGLKEADPATALPRAVADETFGFYMFRNRWKDENDTLVTVQTRNTRGWHKANTRGRVWIWGLGKKSKIGDMKGEKVRHWQPAADGSGILTVDETSLAVDFSGASGADGMIVMTGKGAAGQTSVQAGGTTYQFTFLTEGKAPRPRADGDRVVVGKQTVSVEDGNLVLGKMAGEWQPPK